MEVGSYTNTGGRVARAINTGELELEVPLDRFDSEWIRIGDKVKVHSDNTGQTWMGTVIRKSQFVDPNTQSQGVFIHLNNHLNSTLLAGEYYRAEFPGHPVEGVMEVPRNVVFNTNEVFVIVDNRLEKRVANIVKVNENTLLYNGLNEGEILVMQPLINVLEGTLVERLEEGQPVPDTRRGPPDQTGEEDATEANKESDNKKADNKKPGKQG
jgi:hypothetical protein